jgi:hypothetical protein
MPETPTEVFECSEELGGCGRRFGTYETFADHECSPTSAPALSMLVVHRPTVNGQVASCTCGGWEWSTNESLWVDIVKTVQKQYSMHIEASQSLSK